RRPGCLKLSRHLESALAAEAEIQQHEVGPQLNGASDGLRARRGGIDLYPLQLEQCPRGLEETGVIVDQKAAQRHTDSISLGPLGGQLPLTRTSVRPPPSCRAL